MLQLAGLAPPWLIPSSVGCWKIKFLERYPLCISQWGAFIPHDTVINSSGLLRHPDCCSLPALLSFHWIIRCCNLDLERCILWILFLVPTEIRYFNIAKSPSTTHHFQWKFFFFLEPNYCLSLLKRIVLPPLTMTTTTTITNPYWNTHLLTTMPNSMGQGVQGRKDDKVRKTISQILFVMYL